MLELDMMINVLAELFVQEQLLEKEYAEARDNARNRILRAFREDHVDYDSYELYGSPNDTSLTPLPDLTPQNDDGYMGLDAPLN